MQPKDNSKQDCPHFLEHFANSDKYVECDGCPVLQRFPFELNYMTLIKDTLDCSTYAVRGLDNQLIQSTNDVQPNLLVRIDDLNIHIGSSVHPWLQSQAKEGLKRAILQRGKTMQINSALRTIAAQQLLRSHYECNRCGIRAAAMPGQSNHNAATAIDVEDANGWKPYLEQHGWEWIGSFDPMHFDFVGLGVKNIHPLSVLAFQRLWNQCRPKDQLVEDGLFGEATASRVKYSPAEGFPGVTPARFLRLTDPIQQGQDVGLVQIALRKQGFNIDVANMLFTQNLKTAICQFQEKNNLVVDGVVGPVVRRALGLA